MAALNDARTPLLAAVAAAVVNVGLAFALVPAFDAEGAAAANVGAQLVATAALYAVARRRSGPVVWELGSLARAALAAAACAAAARGVLELTGGGAAGVVLAIGVGVATFAGLAFALRALSFDDGAWLDGHFGHLLGGRAGALTRRASKLA